jgi:hypothetical protein
MTDEEAKNKILEHANAEISPQTQEMLNKPLAHPDGIEEKDRDFLAMLADKIQKGEIKLYQPVSLMNHAIYDKLGEEARGKADIDAFNMLATIRDIYRLWQAGERDSYQIENMVHRIRLTKEKLEEAGGDIYII